MFKSIRPIVKATNPELYAEHTFHMKRCVPYTYNYAAMDDYIVQNWATKSMKQMAQELNEYQERVEYRVQVLKTLNFIKDKRTGKTALIRQRRELRMQLKKVEAKLSEIGAA